MLVKGKPKVKGRTEWPAALGEHIRTSSVRHNRQPGWPAACLTFGFPVDRKIRTLKFRNLYRNIGKLKSCDARFIRHPSVDFSNMWPVMEIPKFRETLFSSKFRKFAVQSSVRYIWGSRWADFRQFWLGRQDLGIALNILAGVRKVDAACKTVIVSLFPQTCDFTHLPILIFLCDTRERPSSASTTTIHYSRGYAL